MAKNRKNRKLRKDLKSELILSIETAIDGGSICIADQKSRIETANWVGENKISKAEDVLDNIAFLIEKNGIENKIFAKILFTIGAGSATGLKIGSAIAKGLARSFGCPYIEISLLDVLERFSSSISAKSKIFYLPAGVAGVIRICLKEKKFDAQFEIISPQQFQIQFYEFTKKSMPDNLHCFVHTNLLKSFECGQLPKNKNYMVIERNLATQSLHTFLG